MTIEDKKILLEYLKNAPMPKPMDNSIFECEKCNKILTVIMCFIRELESEVIK